MTYRHLPSLAVTTLALTTLCSPGLALGDGPAEPLPAMSEIEQEAVFVTAVNSERRYRSRLAKLRRLRELARASGNQRRIHEIEQLMDDNHRRHEARVARFSGMLEGKERWDLVEAMSDGRADTIDWAPRRPGVTEATVRRHVRGQLGQKSDAGEVLHAEREERHEQRADHREDRRDRHAQRHETRHDRRADRRDRRHDHKVARLDRRDDRRADRREDRQDARADRREKRTARLEQLRPELRRHLEQLKPQSRVDEAARDLTAATAEAEYQLLRQELMSDR